MSEILNSIIPIVAVFVAYFLGKQQGQDQSRFDKQTEVLNEIRAKIFDLKFNVELLPHKKNSEDRYEFSHEFTIQSAELARYRRKYRPWLPPEAESLIDPIHKSFANIAKKLIYDEGINDVASGLKYDEAVEEAEGFALDDLIAKLEEFASRLMKPRPTLIEAFLLTFVKNLPGADRIRQSVKVLPIEGKSREDKVPMYIDSIERVLKDAVVGGVLEASEVDAAVTRQRVADANLTEAVNKLESSNKNVKVADALDEYNQANATIASLVRKAG